MMGPKGAIGARRTGRGRGPAAFGVGGVSDGRIKVGLAGRWGCQEGRFGIAASR